MDILVKNYEIQVNTSMFLANKFSTEDIMMLEDSMNLKTNKCIDIKTLKLIVSLVKSWICNGFVIEFSIIYGTDFCRDNAIILNKETAVNNYYPIIQLTCDCKTTSIIVGAIESVLNYEYGHYTVKDDDGSIKSIVTIANKTMSIVELITLLNTIKEIIVLHKLENISVLISDNHFNNRNVIITKDKDIDYSTLYT